MVRKERWAGYAAERCENQSTPRSVEGAQRGFMPCCLPWEPPYQGCLSTTQGPGGSTIIARTLRQQKGLSLHLSLGEELLSLGVFGRESLTWYSSFTVSAD